MNQSSDQKTLKINEKGGQKIDAENVIKKGARGEPKLTTIRGGRFSPPLKGGTTRKSPL